MLVNHLQIVRYRIPFPGNLSMAPYRCLPPPSTRATRKQRTNKLGRCYQPGRPFCTLTRCSLPSRTAPVTYMCLSAQVSGGETRVHAGRWHAGRSLHIPQSDPLPTLTNRWQEQLTVNVHTESDNPQINKSSEIGNSVEIKRRHGVLIGSVTLGEFTSYSPAI